MQNRRPRNTNISYESGEGKDGAYTRRIAMIFGGTKNDADIQSDAEEDDDDEDEDYDDAGFSVFKGIGNGLCNMKNKVVSGKLRH